MAMNRKRGNRVCVAVKRKSGILAVLVTGRSGQSPFRRFIAGNTKIVTAKSYALPQTGFKAE
jgi:hypothetical protein